MKDSLMGDPGIICRGLAEMVEDLIKGHELGEITREDYARICEDTLKKVPEWLREIAALCAAQQIAGIFGKVNHER